MTPTDGFSNGLDRAQGSLGALGGPVRWHKRAPNYQSVPFNPNNINEFPDCRLNRSIQRS